MEPLPTDDIMDHFGARYVNQVWYTNIDLFSPLQNPLPFLQLGGC